MSVIAMLPPSIVKEVRALAFPWLACLAAMIVPGFLHWHFRAFILPAYFIGAAALGALAIGHEYTGRTLGLLLSLPVRRTRLLATKLAVLAVMLLALRWVAEALIFSVRPAPLEIVNRAASVLPVLCGLFLAPWLTMICRNPIAGTVFSLAIPGMLLVSGDIAGGATDGRDAEMETYRMSVVWFGTIGICAIAAVMSWGTFMRLEAIEGRGEDVRLPEWLRLRGSADTAKRHFTRQAHLWLLAKKELRLQQLPLVLAAIYTLGWLAMFWLMPRSTDGDTVGVFTLAYGLFLSILIGSSASAEERHIGSLEWQILLPVAAWKQWAIKVAVVLGLSTVLALGLPTALIYLSGLADETRSVPAYAIAVVVLLATGSLYVSSLSRSGLRALVASIPATLAAMIFLQFAGEWLGPASYFAARRVLSGLAPMSFGVGEAVRLREGLVLLLIAGFVALLLRFALVNHRSADRPPSRVVMQVIVMAACATTAVIAVSAVTAFHR